MRAEGRGGWGTYGPDVLSAGWRRPIVIPSVPVEVGMVVECAASGWCGAVVTWAKEGVQLEDREGARRWFPMSTAAFLLDGKPITLVRPTPAATAKRRTASGSVAVEGARARVARESRIWVEGIHDAELVEQVWGDDLRIEGVVVERLDGADGLPDAVRAFSPGPVRRLGVLLDHVVAGSKESRLASEASRAGPGSVLILGHPYVDVWQTVRPAVARHRRVAGDPPRHALEGRRLRGAGLAARDAGRHQGCLGADPLGRAVVRRPRADLPARRRGARRLRHRLMSTERPPAAS